MTEDEILGNKLIAEFIDLTPHNMFPDELQAPGEFSWMAVGVNVRADYDKEDDEFISFENLFEFHSSWDWLIPVIDKIYSMNEYIEYKDYMNNIICDGGIDINTRFIQITFSDVVEFIKWYNNKIYK